MAIVCSLEGDPPLHIKNQWGAWLPSSKQTRQQLALVIHMDVICHFQHHTLVLHAHCLDLMVHLLERDHGCQPMA